MTRAIGMSPPGKRSSRRDRSLLTVLTRRSREPISRRLSFDYGSAVSNPPRAIRGFERSTLSAAGRMSRGSGRSWRSYSRSDWPNCNLQRMTNGFCG